MGVAAVYNDLLLVPKTACLSTQAHDRASNLRKNCSVLR